MTLHNDPITGYLKSPRRPECVLGRKYNKQKNQSISFYLKEQKQGGGDYYFTENPAEIGYNKYKERLKTALRSILTVRGYDESAINSLLKINAPILKEHNNRKKSKKNNNMASKRSAPSRGDADSSLSRNARKREAKTETDIIQLKAGTSEIQEIQEEEKK